jgi:predicted nucleic acid-binding protein
MIVIADTSPIHYLILIGEINLLPRLYDQIIISNGVLAELTADATPEKVKRWLSNMPGWLETRSLPGPVEKSLTDILDLGESEAIQLATDLNADLLLIDEKIGRDIATKRGLRIVGTIGVPASASEKGLVEVEQSLSRLESTNFYVSDELKKYLLKQNKN